MILTIILHIALYIVLVILDVGYTFCSLTWPEEVQSFVSVPSHYWKSLNGIKIYLPWKYKAACLCSVVLLIAPIGGCSRTNGCEWDAQEPFWVSALWMSNLKLSHIKPPALLLLLRHFMLLLPFLRVCGFSFFFRVAAILSLHSKREKRSPITLSI